VARNKRNLEKIEAAASASTMNKPPLIEAAFCYSLLTNRPAQSQSREPIVSEAKKDLIIMLDRIADRWNNAPPLPVPPLTLDMTCPGLHMNKTSANRADDPDVPLHELLKQTKLLMLKATRK
jgi:hypothetical protein